MGESHYKPVKCPNCGANFDWHDNVPNMIAGGDETYFKDTPPGNFDLSFCIRCGSVGFFIDDRVIRIVEDDLPEQAKLQLIVIRNSWKKVIKDENVSS